MAKPAHTLLISSLGILMLATQARSQTPPAQKPSFEVASIKPNTSGSGRLSVDASGNRFVATNVPVTTLLRFAFDHRLSENKLLLEASLFSGSSGFQIIGGPSWINKERFDIEAKAALDNSISQSELQLMMQSLLEDRFQLKAHTEMRDLPTYNLIVVKDGKMTLSPPEGTPSPATAQGAKSLPSLPRGRISIFTEGNPNPSALLFTVLGNAIPVSTLATSIQSWAGRPITDKTNLKGLFDILFRFSPEGAAAAPTLSPGTPPSDPPGPSLFTAIQELGLKLEPSKAPFDVLVIDSVQKPSEN